VRRRTSTISCAIAGAWVHPDSTKVHPARKPSAAHQSAANAARWHSPPESSPGLRSSKLVKFNISAPFAPCRDFRARQFPQHQAKRHVFKNVKCGSSGVMLEHHRHIPVLRRDALQRLSIQPDVRGPAFPTRQANVASSSCRNPTANDYEQFSIGYYQI